MQAAEEMRDEVTESVRTIWDVQKDFFKCVEDRMEPLAEEVKKDLVGILRVRGVDGAGGVVEGLRSGYILNDSLEVEMGVKGEKTFFFNYQKKTSRLPNKFNSTFRILEAKDNFTLRMYHSVMAEEGIEEFMAREEEELDELPDNLKVTYRRLEIEYAALKVNLARKREEGKREEEKQRIAGVFAEFAKPLEETGKVLYLPQQ